MEYSPILCLAATLTAFVSFARADILHVDHDNCPGPGDGSELDPYCSIQVAINAAVDMDEIIVAAGAYFETIDFLGKAITLRSADGPDMTTIDATGFFHGVRCVSGEGPASLLCGFTVTGGNANAGFPDNGGGGMVNLGSSPTVVNCVFTGNAATTGGGMVNAFGSNPIVSDCVFSNNVAGDGNGGGILNSESSPSIENCLFVGNSAHFNGGGMYNTSGSNPSIVACTFVDNTVEISNGGGISNVESSPTVIDCTFSQNTAGHNGGALGNRTNSDPVLVDCLFIGNSAIDSGGGMRAGRFCSPSLISCTFRGNSSESGGAISVGSGTAGIIGNTVVTDCILWGNMALLGPEIALIGTFPGDVTVSYSDVAGGEADVYVQPGFTLNWGAGNIDADPLYVDPDNGDLRLLPGSPCIDAGDNSALPEGIETDLEGNPRFVDDLDSPDCPQAPGTCGDPPVVDMGAYEFQGIPCPWDLDGSGSVGTADLLGLLSQWGTDPGGPPDFDSDGNVGTSDLLELLANWGPCLP